MNKPILGISMGDPFGNGPEITVKALSDKTIYDRLPPRCHRRRQLYGICR